MENQSLKQQPHMEKSAEECKFLRSKYREYKEKIHQCQDALLKSGTDQSLYHREMVKKSDELQELKDKIAPMKAKLDTYHNLPPDLSLTKVKIEEMKREVAALEAELCQNINLMHM